MGASFRATISGMVCSGGSRGGAWGTRPPPPLFLDETKARRVGKNFLGSGPPPYLRVWITPFPLPPLTQDLNPALVWVVLTGNQKLN